MPRSRRSAGKAIGTLLGAAAVALVATAGAARADSTTYILTQGVFPPGKPIAAFDISAVSARDRLYALADRTNAGVDVIDSTNNSFLFRIGGFKGVVLKADGTANNALSGPDGVVFVGDRFLWAGDGDSTMKVIDLLRQTIVDVISTGGKFRVDEMASDPKDRQVLAANNADTPPFATIFSTVPNPGTNSHPILAQIKFNNAGGAEQPQFDSKTGFYYQPLDDIDGTTTTGALAVVSPKAHRITHQFPLFTKCDSPSGLAIDARRGLALVGCNGPVQIINLKTGAIVAVFPALQGPDQVWYNPGTDQYIVPARCGGNAANCVAPQTQPVLGIIDAGTDQIVQQIPISQGDHSVAEDPVTSTIYLPGTLPGTAFPDCIGCILVFQPG